MPGRPSSGKRERERAKRFRADEKRLRRQDGVGALPAEPSAGPRHGTEAVLAAVARTQEAFDRGELTFEDYEHRKTELLSSLVVE